MGCECGMTLDGGRCVGIGGNHSSLWKARLSANFFQHCELGRSLGQEGQEGQGQEGRCCDGASVARVHFYLQEGSFLKENAHDGILTPSLGP